MPIDSIFLDYVVKELETINGLYIEKIHCPMGGVFVFSLRRKKLFVNLNSTPYITILNESFENPQNPPMFCMLLRKHLQGGKITSIKKANDDRIVEITVSSANELGDLSEYKIYIELFGAGGNLLLTKDGKIIDCYKKSDLERSIRIIAPGAIYTFPEKNGSGFSPLISRELEYLNKDITYLKNNARPIALVDNKGNYKDLTFCEIKQYEGLYENRTFDSFVSLLNEFFESRRKSTELKNLSADILKTVNTLLLREEKKLNFRKQDLENTKKRDTFRIYGELLKANLYKINAGDKFAVVENYYDNLKPISIPLKENLSPQKNADKYFKDYKKLCNAANTLISLIENSEKEIFYLLSVKDALLRCKDANDILSIKEELINEGLIKNQKKKTRTSQKKFLEYNFKGFKILVGKNNIENDLLTLKTASKNDLWFHVKAAPGSHVVIIKNGMDINEEVILFAANLAALNSSSNLSSNVAVDYTEIKNIKKPVGAKPGMVIYKTNKTVYVTPNKINT